MKKQLPNDSFIWWLPFWTLLKRECYRFFDIPITTLVIPFVSTSLYLLIFGLSLGRHINVSGGIPYLHFIIPGLVIMGVINSATNNASSSMYFARINGSITDLLIAPLSPSAMALGYILAGTFRALLVGTAVFTVGVFFGAPLPLHPLLALAVAAMTGWIFAAFGAIMGTIARRFEGVHIFTGLTLQPLIYLSGVFYSLNIIPPFWQHVSRLNPIYYIVDAFRYASIDLVDFHPVRSLTVIISIAIVSTGMFIQILRQGTRLRS